MRAINYPLSSRPRTRCRKIYLPYSAFSRECKKKMLPASFFSGQPHTSRLASRPITRRTLGQPKRDGEAGGESLRSQRASLGFRLTHPTPRSSGPDLPLLETRTEDPGRGLASMKGPTREERCPGFRIQPSDPSEFLIPPYAFAGYPPNTALRSTEHSTGLPDCPENGVFSCSVSGRMISFVLKLWVQSLRDANTS